MQDEWGIATAYINSLPKVPMLAIMYGPWVTGEAYVMEVKPPINLIIIMDGAEYSVKEHEAGGLRIVAKIMSPESAFRAVKECDEEFVNAVYSGLFISKNEEFYKRLEDLINGQISAGKLRWDGSRGTWVKAC
ncbi:MAG: hypothetical protein RXQ57_06485 [Caldivirga sp.]